MALHYQTAGESHGPTLVSTVTGLPAGVEIDLELINRELRRRQGGYGRGGRQRIETDVADFVTGVRLGRSIGAPVTMLIKNKDSRLDDLERTPPVHRPRPGHADLPGSIKWLTTDCRETLERASARETAAKTAAGALAKCFLKMLGIEVLGFVRQILDARTELEVTPENRLDMLAAREASETYCPDEEVTRRQKEIIRRAKIDKDTVGGIVEAHVFNCPPGFGSSMDSRDRLDARLAYAVMGIQAFKAAEIGAGRDAAHTLGSKLHDPITHDPSRADTHTLGFERPSNNAGGTEGGMTNGMPIVVKGTMKPIATILQGLPSVDLNTKESQESQYERSDICAVSAASVVMENLVAFEVARAVLEKVGGDSMTETEANFESYLRYARMLPLSPPSDVIA
ncbi:MAG: chorismate synthase [Planctomycetota bacterium]